MIKSFIGPLILTFLLAMFVLLLNFLWKYIDDLVGKGLSMKIIAELLFYTSAGLVSMALPLAILFASIMTFGNLGENNELLACKAAGISLQRFMLPLIVMTIILTYGAFLFSNHILPYSNLKMKTLLHSIKHQKPEIQIPPGIFYNGIEGYTIKIDEKDNKTNLLQKIRIYDHTSDIGNVSITYADSGYIKMTEDERYLTLVLYNGYSYNEEENFRKRSKKPHSYPHRRDIFKKQTLRIQINQEFIRTDENLLRRSYQMLNVGQLHEEIDTSQANVIRLKQKLNKGLNQKHLFKNDKKIKNPENYYKPQSRPPVFRGDSIFEQLSLVEKKSVLRQSLNYSRASKQQVENIESRIQIKTEHLRRYQVALHQKYTFPFACFIFFFIGAPLGAIIRKGGLGLPAVISILFFILYYVISLTGEKIAREDIVPPYFGMWLSSAVLLPLGIFLTYKATTDSVLLNSEIYFEYITKIFRKRLSSEKIALIPFDKKFKTIPPPKSQPTVDEISLKLNKLLKKNDKILPALGKIDYSIFIEYVQYYREVYGLIQHNDLIYSVIQNQMKELPFIEPRKYKQIVGLKTRYIGSGKNNMLGVINYSFLLIINYGKLYELKDLLQIAQKKTFHFITLIEERIAVK